MKKILILVILTTFVVSASVYCEKAPSADENSLRIATWNLEWFGALGRTPEDISRIAEIIKNQEIDILALQEITCGCTLEALAEELEYNYFLSPQRTPQKLALLWNPEKASDVEFDQQAFDALEKVADHGMGRPSRQPLVFNIKAGEFDFRLMVVHLKSIPEAEYSLKVRNIQYGAINSWLKGALRGRKSEQDIIIAGDFNSYNNGVSSETLRKAKFVEFTSTAYTVKEYSNIWYSGRDRRNLSLIDHIAITPALKNGEFIKLLPVKDLDVEMGEAFYENRISDHLPVVAVFSYDKDID